MFAEDMTAALGMFFCANKAGSPSHEYGQCDSDGLSFGGSDASSGGVASSASLDLSSTSSPACGSVQTAASQVSEGWASTWAEFRHGLNNQMASGGARHSPIRQSGSHVPAAAPAQRDGAASGSGNRHVSPVCPPYSHAPAAAPSRMHDAVSAGGMQSMRHISPAHQAAPVQKRQSVTMPGTSLPGPTPSTPPPIKARATTLPGDSYPASMPTLFKKPSTASPPTKDSGHPLIPHLQATIKRLRSERDRHEAAIDCFRKQAVSALHSRDALNADRKVLELALIESQTKALRLEKALEAERAARAMDQAAAAEASKAAELAQASHDHQIAEIRSAFVNEKAQYWQLLNKFVKRIGRYESDADEGAKGALQWAALQCERRVADINATCEQRLQSMQEECHAMLDDNLSMFEQQLLQQNVCLAQQHDQHMEQLHAGYLEQLQQQEAHHQQQQQQQQVAAPQHVSGLGPDELDALIKRAQEEGRREAWAEITQSYNLSPKAKPSGWKRLKAWVKAKVSALV